MNSSERYQNGATISTWDKVSDNYEWDNYWKGYENKAHLHILLSYIGDPREKTIIEVGCGSGFLSIALALKGAQCSLLDISSKSLRIAIDGFTRFGLEEPDSYNEDALASTVSSNKFDIVYNIGVIEHFFDEGKELLLKEMYRMAKPGGKIIITAPNAWCLPFQFAQILKKWRGTWTYGYEDDMSPGRLYKLAKRCGYNNSQSYAYNKVVGLAWVPRIGYPIVQKLGWNTFERHCQRSCMGYVSILIINKEA